MTCRALFYFRGASRGKDLPHIRSSKKEAGECYKVTLSDLFLNDNNVPLKDYLSSSVNIAFHYGLQIFNSVITVGDGYLYVKSGKENADVFTNNTDTYFNIGNLDYMFGTAYIIFIPFNIG